MGTGKISIQEEKLIQILTQKIGNDGDGDLSQYWYEFFSALNSSKLEVVENYFSKEKQPIELDLYLRYPRLGLEYRGEQHYYDSYSLKSQWNQPEKDREKRSICHGNGITLI